MTSFADSPSPAISAMGTTLGPDVLQRSRALFDAEQGALASRVPVAAADCVYGPHERHRLDLYGGGEGTGLRPVVLFVHGGGFWMGDKGGEGEGRWPNAAVGRMAAERGWLGAVMNYRLAPDNPWPAGSEDVLAALDWLRGNAARHGGDPERIFLLGTSAGAVHCAGAVKLRPDLAVRGIVLLSGLYGYTPLDPRDCNYYEDMALYPQRMPREAVASTGLPLLLACAQFDPPRFQAEWAGLVAERLEHCGTLPRCHYASGHNHYTMALHLGTSDRRLADEIATFVSEWGS